MNAGRYRRHTEAGFTLIELTVALLAGLLVAMGIVALSREATTTFHEEARSSAAEASLRSAVDRLRADIERAGFMSTGNIQAINTSGTPRIAKPLSASTNVPTANTPSGLTQLRSLVLIQGGSLLNTLPLSAVQNPAFTPDILQISGNMTTSDQYEIATYSTNVGACTRIFLVPSSPALYRVIGLPPYAANAAENLRRVFFPTGIQGTQFLLRIVDTSGCAQYLATCTVAPGAGLQGSNPYVDVAGTTPLVTAAMTGTTCGITGFGEGSVINPIQTVQWEITMAGATDVEPAAYTNLGGSSNTPAPGKYDLMRSFLDAGLHIVPDTSEVIAEYAVNLSFAFSVDTGTALAPSIVTYPFDDPADNNPYGVYSATLVPNVGPERIRSVQARVMTRAALPDRSVNIAVPSYAGNYGSENYAYRYCTQTAGCPASNPTNALNWARTRTLVTEVALPNQAGNFY